MKFLIKRIHQNRNGFLLAFVAILLVFGWRLFAVMHHSIPGHDWRKIAAELGSVPQFRRERYILANHAHTCVVYNQDVEKTVGFFFCNIPEGKKIFLCEGLQTDWFGWSPDDSLFIYRTSVETNSNQLKFVICDGKNGRTLNELQADNSGRVAWLSSRAFVYEVNSTLVVIEKKPDGTWIKKKTWPGYPKNASHLTGITETSVAWQEQNQPGPNQVAYSGTNEQWIVTKVNGDQYKIAKADGLALAAEGSTLALQSYTGAKEQLWKFTGGAPNCNIMNVGSGENLDDWGGGLNSIVGLYNQQNTNPNQQWKLSRIGESSPGQTFAEKNTAIADGTYKISCPSGGDFALSFRNGSESVIRQMDVNTGSINTLWQATTNRLFEFTYSLESREFLLNCIDADGQYVIRYYPATKWMADGGRIVKGKDEWISNVTLDKGSLRYAYLNENDLGSFDIRANTGSEVITLPWHGGVTQYALFGNDLFITGNPEHESPGMWHYNLATKSLECVALEATDHYRYAKRVQPICGVTTNTLGDETAYYLWPPAEVLPGKKYPIIITQTVNEWLPYQEAAANAGYYFAIARRSTFHNKRQDKWGADVMGVYQTLVQNMGLNIDTNQMYLWGRCGETDYISNLLNITPNLWKGLILFDPSGLPEFEKIRNKRIFLITGREADNAQELLKYQADGLAQGIPMKLILQDHIGHLSMSVATERARTIWFTEFLLQSK